MPYILVNVHNGTRATDSPNISTGFLAILTTPYFSSALPPAQARIFDTSSHVYQQAGYAKQGSKCIAMSWVIWPGMQPCWRVTRVVCLVIPPPPPGSRFVSTGMNFIWKPVMHKESEWTNTCIIFYISTLWCVWNNRTICKLLHNPIFSFFFQQ
jgi:hypothetical protein